MTTLETNLLILNTADFFNLNLKYQIRIKVQLLGFIYFFAIDCLNYSLISMKKFH